MTLVRDILRDADPLRDDLRYLEHARGRLRRTVVEAAGTDAAPHERFRSRRAAIALTAAGIGTLAVVGTQLWPGGGATLQAAVRFEVRLAEDLPAPGLTRAQVRGTSRVVYLHPEAVVTNGDIAQSRVIEGGTAGRFNVSVAFSAAGVQKMRQATAAHIGRPVAILLDGEVALAPVVRSAISGAALVSGDFTKAEADRIAEGIAIGALTSDLPGRGK